MKYAIDYLYRGDRWTYTSCGSFQNDLEALGHFYEQMHDAKVICYFRIKLKY